MTNKERLANAAKTRKVVKRWYASEGPDKVLARLKAKGIEISLDHLQHVASSLKIAYRDPKVTQQIREAVQKHYPTLGQRGVAEHLKNAHGIKVSSGHVKNVAVQLRVQYAGGSKGGEPLEDKLRELIADGALTKTKIDPIVELYQLLRTKAEAAKIAPNFLANRDEFRKKVLEIVWDKKTQEALEKIVRRGMSLDTFLKYHSHIPQKFAEAKAKELRGVSNVKHPAAFMRGIGRVTDASDIDSKHIVKFAKTSIDQPYDLGITKSRWMGRVVNGANIGIKHSPLIEENPVRCSLANASRRQNDFVVLTNLIDLDLKKAAGPQKVYRAQISGYNTNPDILSESYQSRARHILKHRPKGQLIYETVAEMFLNVLSGWSKICRRPDGKPEFDGPVIIIFGTKEDEFIKTAAYWELRYLTILRQKDLEVELSLANKEIKDARKDGATKEQLEPLIENRDNIAEELSRTKVSNLRREDLEDYEKRIRTYVVRKFEEAIPNAKVIGQRSAYVKIGDETVLFEIPSSANVTDAILANFANHYGPRALRGELPKTTVLCHPYALNFRATKRELDAQGKRGDAYVFTAPVAVDEKFLRTELDQTARAAHPLEKAIWTGQFQAGIMDLDCVHGIVSANSFSIKSVIKAELGRGIFSKNRLAPKDQYIWVMDATDPHWGWKWKEFVLDSETDRFLGVGEAVMQMMRRQKLFENGKLPVHMFLMNDDPVQGNHFQIQQSTHQNRVPYYKMEQKWAELMAEARQGDAAKRLSIIEKMREWDLFQTNVRGEDWTQEQMEQVVRRHLEPNVDFFDALLARATDAKIAIRGKSAFNDEDHVPPGTPDHRDIGLVNYGTGNHFAATVNDELMEGWFYAHMLRLLLAGRPRWNGKSSLLEELVKAPVYGNISVGWGTVSAPGGYEWGVEFRNKPPRLSSWGDTLLAAVRNDESRGNYSRIFDGRVTLKTYGDKHFFGAVNTSHTIYRMGMPGTPTEVYGEHGFPPNNTGVTFIGLPVSGPDGGPILDRCISFSVLRDYFKKPFDFDWADFLPDPV